MINMENQGSILISRISRIKSGLNYVRSISEKALELDPDLEKNNPTQYEEMSYALGVCYKEEANFIKAAEYLKVIKLKRWILIKITVIF